MAFVTKAPTSNQFSDAMRDLRQQSRDMMERQDEIARDLSDDQEKTQTEQQNGPASLRSNRDRDELEEDAERDSLLYCRQ